MSKPSSILRGSVRRLRRPSPAMVVAIVALVMATGGASYAAVALPNASVGAAQLKTFAVTNPKLATNAVGPNKIMASAVTFDKIKPGSVGTKRIVPTQVQERVSGTCSNAGQSIAAISQTGTVTCANSNPTVVTSGAPTTQTTLGGTAVSLASLALAGGTGYEVDATPRIQVTPGATDSGADTVTISCTLAAGPSTTGSTTQSTTVYLAGPNTTTQTTSLPLTALAPSSATAITSSVSCSETATNGNTPTVKAQTTIFAMGANTPAATATTTTTTPAA